MRSDQGKSFWSPFLLQSEEAATALFRLKTDSARSSSGPPYLDRLLSCVRDVCLATDPVIAEPLHARSPVGPEASLAVLLRFVLLRVLRVRERPQT
jgi:hypothetical protein